MNTMNTLAGELSRKIVLPNGQDRAEAISKLPIAAVSHGEVKILLAGLDTPENNYTRQIEGYGFEVIRYAGYGKADFSTDCHAAVIVVSHLSHGDFYNVKDTYKQLNRRVFIANGGFAQVKNDFEYHFFEDFRDKLNVIDTNSRLQFLLCYLFKERNGTMDFQDLLNRVRRLFPTESETAIKNLQINATQSGIISSARRGVWRFHGLTERVYNKLVDLGLPMTTDWLMLGKEETSARIIPVAATPAPISVVISKPDPEVVQPDAPMGMKEELSLVTSTVSDMEKRLLEMHSMMQLNMQDRPTTERLIQERLSKFSDAKLRSLWELIRS